MVDALQERHMMAILPLAGGAEPDHTEEKLQI